MKIERGFLPTHPPAEKIAGPNAQGETPKNEKVLKAAQMFENQFLREMVKAMRKTVPESELVQTNMAEKMYREQLDDNTVENWVDRGGIGLQDVIYDQIMERFYASGKVARPKGPLPMEKQESFQMKPLQSPNQKGMPLSFQIEKLSPQATSVAILSPWEGDVTAQGILPDGSTSMKIRHTNGLESLFAFQGPGSGATKVDAGSVLGYMSPEARSVFWKIQSGES